jgi:hypothetical protein
VEQGQQLARDHNAQFFEVIAKDGSGIDNMIMESVRWYLKLKADGLVDEYNNPEPAPVRGRKSDRSCNVQ